MRERIQPKLEVGRPDDKYEREADRVADVVLRMAGPTDAKTGKEEHSFDQPMSQLPTSGEHRFPLVPRWNRENEEQRKGEDTRPHSPATDGDWQRELQSLQGGGRPISETTRAFFEPRFGYDFDDVRVHSGEQAAALASAVGALAFASGRDIVLGDEAPGEGTPAETRLLAHELTHVIQQGAAPPLAGTHHTEFAPPTGQLVQRQVIAEEEPRPTATIPEGGQPVDRVGIVNWDGNTPLRLRSSRTTEADNIVSRLQFNTHVQVIKQFPGDWYFVATEDGDLGYVASTYIWTDLPEPNAYLHRVESGVEGTAIAISERYYGQHVDDWGQDLRFYVNVLAWANNIDISDTTGGWREVEFDADDLIWVPSYRFARGLSGVVSSGSISYETLETVGLASFIERAGQLWDDFAHAVGLSWQYIGEALRRHGEEAIMKALESLVVVAIGAIAILALSTAIGAAVGALAGGVGAAPGAAAGFEVGIIILQWLGLALLVTWIGQAIWDIASAFTKFIGMVWEARGDEDALDRAARQHAEAWGVLFEKVIEAIVLIGATRGLGRAFGLIKNSRLEKALGTKKAREWLTERVRRVRSGESEPIPRPSTVRRRLYREVEIRAQDGSNLGEFDTIDMTRGIFIEHTSGVGGVNPLTGRPGKTPAQWARDKIFKKTRNRIQNMSKAETTAPKGGTGDREVPTLQEIQGIRHIHFVIDSSAPAVRASVAAELANLRTEFPSWNFTAEFGVGHIPPVPDLESDAPSTAK